MQCIHLLAGGKIPETQQLKPAGIHYLTVSVGHEVNSFCKIHEVNDGVCYLPPLRGLGKISVWHLIDLGAQPREGLSRWRNQDIMGEFQPLFTTQLPKLKLGLKTTVSFSQPGTHWSQNGTVIFLLLMQTSLELMQTSSCISWPSHQNSSGFPLVHKSS